MKKEDSVCIEDFCGYAEPGHFFTQFWADYYPSEKVVRFGGDWREIPNLKATRKPSLALVHRWVKASMAVILLAPSWLFW